MAETMLDSDASYVMPHIYVTLDDEDENRVLELVRTDGPKMFVRENGDWTEIDPEADNDRVWEKQIMDISEDALPIFDDTDGDVSRLKLAKYSMPSDAHLYLTVADEDENQVLELVRSDETGTYIRKNSEWVVVDGDNERVWDRVMIDVAPSAIATYDAGTVSANEFEALQ